MPHLTWALLQEAWLTRSCLHCPLPLPADPAHLHLQPEGSHHSGCGGGGGHCQSGDPHLRAQPGEAAGGWAGGGQGRASGAAVNGGVCFRRSSPVRLLYGGSQAPYLCTLVLHSIVSLSCSIQQGGVDLGRIASLEKDHKAVDVARRGDTVAMKIEVGGGSSVAGLQ